MMGHKVSFYPTLDKPELHCLKRPDKLDGIFPQIAHGVAGAGATAIKARL
jgi:hypothetical protein